MAEIERAGSQHGRWIQLDVTDPDSASIIQKLEEDEEGGGIDVLVSNAGLSVHAVVEAFTENEVRRQMEVLYLGPFRLVRAVVPHMRRRRFGVVINMSTGAALEGRESMGTYAAGKAATDGKEGSLISCFSCYNEIQQFLAFLDLLFFYFFIIIIILIGYLLTCENPAA